MTPLEGGLLLGVIFFFGGSFLFPRGSLWGGFTLFTVGATLVAWNPSNTHLVGWTPWVAHLGGVSTTGGIPTYSVAHLGGSLMGGDLKFLTLALLGVAGFCFVRRIPSGYEPLLIGLVSVSAGLLTFGVDHLVLLYLTLELQALSLYTLVGFYKFDEERTDVAIRYLLSGSLVSGFMLVGFAQGYGYGGTFLLSDLPQLDRLGSAWVVGVLLFKAGVAPFHFWAPLVYTPLEWGTLAVTLGATKVNIWYLLVGNLSPLVGSAWWPLWGAALLSVGVGSVGGFFQTNLGGILAYSGVINGGYLVLLLLGGSPWVFGYYLVTYFIGTLALVGWASAWGDPRVETLRGWNTLGVATPLVLYYLALNLGGLPVFPGFFGKLALLGGLAPLGWFTLWGVVVASLVPAVYYVSLVGAPLFTPTETEVVLPRFVSPGVVAYLVIGLSGLAGLVVSVV